MSLDPVVTNPDLYKIVFENERVRVSEYLDKPGDKTTPHTHPDSVMYTLSSFQRRLNAEGNESRDVAMQSGHVELKEPGAGTSSVVGSIGPVLE
jgi:hypothetical protein